MAQEYSSGTVSKILWHFTGGPNWDIKNNKQFKNRKSFNEAFENLKAIIESKNLRLSKYQEVVKIRVPQYIRSIDKRWRTQNGFTDKEIEASPICCLADIPIQHLSYHAKRYGKFAIGFHRKSVVKNSFNPVFYSLNDTKVVNSIYSGLTEIDLMNFRSIQWKVDDIFRDLDDNECLNNESDSVELNYSKFELDTEIEELRNSKHEIEKSLQNFIAFIKTFSVDEFNSIYCEREWRSLEQYKFTKHDIAIIVLPRWKGYYKNFIAENLMPGVPVVPWEDLIES